MIAANVLEAAPSTSPGELFRNGQLTAAVAAQLTTVKAHPADHGQRLFLFELLAFAGDFERAGRQLAAINYGDPTLDSTIANYRRLLDAEQARRELFAAGREPLFLMDAPAHVRLRLEAVAALRTGAADKAAQLLAQATEQTPTIAGQLNNQPFTLLVDCDDLFGTVLEVMSATGAYFWLPLEQINTLELETPRSPRDLLWAPATLELIDGKEGNVFLPALYPNSSQSSDEQIQLGRRTDWQAAEGGPTLGAGLRTLLVDENAVSLLDCRSLTISH